MIRIGELSRETGLRASALRYYEDLGLLPAPSRNGGKRLYGDEALDRISFIQFARACGFRLDEIAVLLKASGDKTPVSKRWRQLAAKKLEEMDDVIARAEGMKRFLAAALTCECVGADACGRIVRTQAMLGD
jgi:MerR family transcriptional regulator, redox-sensitive transcriptional activator SoxR